MNTQAIDSGRTRFASILRFKTYLLAFFLFFLIVWINKYFGRPSLEQVLYHLNFGQEGLLDSDPKLLTRFIKWVLIPSLLLSTLAIYLERRRAARRDAAPASDFRRRVGRGLPLIALILSALWLLHRMSAVEFITANYGPDYFSPNYVHPETVQIKAKKPKNLVLVYVESLEASYSNVEQFGSDLLAPLKELGGASFAHYPAAPGTEWTIAGIVSSQCGAPLKSVTVYNGNDQGQVMKSFLPKARCLPDVLDSLGYHNVFMGGASLDFAGKGRYLRSHHYHELYGREEWLAQGADPDYMHGWGLYDDDLFANAKRKLKELHAANKPFNLTLLTVDTHGPRGFVSKDCAGLPRAGKFENIVACTARQVADFVKFIEANGYLEDTRVVITGDHLAMPNPVKDKLALVPERNVFNAFFPAQALNKRRDEIIHFDMFPTILEFIGVEVPGGRMGLGYSALNATMASPPSNRLAEMRESLLNKSETYMELWDMAEEKHTVLAARN